MAEANDVYGSIYQNLIDAGCGTKTTEQCMALVEDGRYCDTLPILTRYRKHYRARCVPDRSRLIALTS